MAHMLGEASQVSVGSSNPSAHKELLPTPTLETPIAQGQVCGVTALHVGAALGLGKCRKEGYWGQAFLISWPQKSCPIGDVPPSPKALHFLPAALTNNKPSANSKQGKEINIHTYP